MQEDQHMYMPRAKRHTATCALHVTRKRILKSSRHGSESSYSWASTRLDADFSQVVLLESCDCLYVWALGVG